MNAANSRRVRGSGLSMDLYPSPGSHLAMRSDLSRKGRGEDSTTPRNNSASPEFFTSSNSTSPDPTGIELPTNPSLPFRTPPMSVMFSPIRLRELTLANRIMVAPMCQYSSENGEANDWHFTHINSLALSGAAIFCIEATAVEAIGRITPGCLGLYSDANEAALKPIMASVRKHSHTAIAMQLAHAGRKGSSHTPWDGGQQIPLAEGGWQVEAPSAVPHKQGEAAPLAFDAAGLKRVRDAFVTTAKRAERLGIDALELHCAHGYLLHQFLSPISNKRTDEYGGSLQNRLRFPLEVFEAVRAAFPDHKPVGIKVSATDWIDGSWDLAQTIEFARQ